MTTIGLIAVIVALVGLDVVAGVVVLAVLWWCEYGGARKDEAR